MFFASGLDEAPAGQTYQGWLINSETDIRSAGLFQANADGTAVLVVSGDLRRRRRLPSRWNRTVAPPSRPFSPPLLAVPLQA